MSSRSNFAGSGAGVLGAVPRRGGGCKFRVWAPLPQKVELHIVAPHDRVVALKKEERGYYSAVVEDAGPGTLYQYRLDGQGERPDPVSRSQPQGVHGPSEVTELSFSWSDAGWQGLPLHEYVLYELHVGAFTPGGTFEAIIPRLDELRELGVNAIELMPVAQFPGSRNWGYDGVYAFAVQDSYGGPAGLKRLVDACHARGLAVVLDVVYNHLGPEGNYLREFGPYFTDSYRTPWGPAINFDGPQSDEVRRFFIENALYWVSEFRVDALRLDAIHAIVDPSARPFLEELGQAVYERARELGRRVYVIAESDRNDARIIRPPQLGGYGLDAQWNDDFHHALHVLLTGERQGYYADFQDVGDLARSYAEGFVYSGQYSAYRRRRHGNSSQDRPGEQFVVFAQNHDQVGNRAFGERLSRLVSFEALRLAAASVLLAPFIPLLFMGEEYGEAHPFQYFVSHSDAALIEAVRRGRQEEFSAFNWAGEIPDPQDEQTFLRSRLAWESRREGEHARLREFYQELLRLRRQLPALSHLDKESVDVQSDDKERVLTLSRRHEGSRVFAVLHFGGQAIEHQLLIPSGSWHKLLDSADLRWGGPGSRVPDQIRGEEDAALSLSPHQAVLFSV
jgi:maltooligosyltrehalose trehalohydrolase